MIKKGNKVKVLVGKDKNKDGEIIEIDRKNFRAHTVSILKILLHVSISLTFSAD